MSNLIVKMKKEEKERYLSLSEEERKIFVKELEKKKRSATFMAAVLAQLSLENIDDLDYFGINRGKILKPTLRTLKTQMHNFLNEVYKEKNKISKEHIDVMTKVSKFVEDTIKEAYEKFE